MRNLLFFFFISATTFSQNDSINLLDEVKLYGNFSKKMNAGFTLQIIQDSVINNSVISLGNLLQKHANLYFKQQGNGMVSSISLRGTGASHTGVYWNGIAINSSLNGQTDFNTLSANGFNQIEIRKGAGSTLFGSGAIAGTINLKDVIRFTPKKEFRASFGLASYNTQSTFIQSVIGMDKFYVKLSVEGEKADNDYPFLNTHLINENGAYKNYQLKSVIAYKVNAINQLRLFTNYSNNYREFPRTITAPSKNLYKNTDNRILLNWLNTGDKYNSDFNLVLLSENYRFYLDKYIDDFFYGETNSFLLKYDFSYLLAVNKKLAFGAENKLTKGNGSSIQKKSRNVFEAYVHYHQKIFNKLTYNTSLRKGFSDVFKIPLIYSLDTRFDVSKKINLRANYSTNYKLPTFNDLYWELSGNENLLPETSTSSELSLNYNSEKINSSITIYQIDSANLIQWYPVSNAFWSPLNIQEVTNKGLEIDVNYRFKLKQHRFNIQSQYAFTKATDNSLNKQLIYVPFHKITSNLNYNYRGWVFSYNHQFNGFVYTTTSNTQYVNNYNLSNIQINKNLLKNTVNIGFHINNLLNKAYQIVTYRPMPNRNYKLNINIKI